MSLRAKTADVTFNDATNCASSIIQLPDFSYLMCLLNTTELVIHTWQEGEQCDTIHLDGSTHLLVVDIKHLCTKGYNYIQATGDDHKCVPVYGKYKLFSLESI